MWVRPGAYHKVEHLKGTSLVQIKNKHCFRIFIFDISCFSYRMKHNFRIHSVTLTQFVSIFRPGIHPTRAWQCSCLGCSKLSHFIPWPLTQLFLLPGIKGKWAVSLIPEPILKTIEILSRHLRSCERSRETSRKELSWKTLDLSRTQNRMVSWLL